MPPPLPTPHPHAESLLLAHQAICGQGRLFAALDLFEIGVISREQGASQAGMTEEGFITQVIWRRRLRRMEFRKRRGR